MLNNKRVKEAVASHENFMGGESYIIKNPINNLRVAAASCFFGEPAYYLDGVKSKKTLAAKPTRLPDVFSKYRAQAIRELEPSLPGSFWQNKTTAELLTTAIDAALDYNFEETLKVAQYLRNEANIRVTPQVILVRAANHPKSKGNGLIRKYASNIVKRGDEPATVLAYQFATYGKKIPMSLKKALKDVLQGFNEYTLAKYRMETREVKTVDVVNMVHAYSPAIDKLVKGNLTLSDETWEAIVSGKGSNLDSWTQAAQVMPHMALLRNIRNMTKAGVPVTDWSERFLSSVKGGRQLPFRYWTAYREMTTFYSANPGPLSKEKVTTLDTIEQALNLSLDNLPSFEGRVMCLTDNSGSAHDTFTSEFGSVTVSEIGNLTSIITAKRCQEGYVGVFGDGLEVIPIRKSSSTFDDLEKVNRIGAGIGQGTEHGIWLFWEQAIKEKTHWDSVFVYSDMQAGHGQLYGLRNIPSSYILAATYFNVPAMIKEYRRVVNPNVKVYLVQTAGYQDTLVPEYFKDTYILGGWSAGILNFAKEMETLSNTPKIQTKQ